MDEQERRAADHLGTLAVCHYVYAGLAACASCMGVFWLAMSGAMFASMRDAADGSDPLQLPRPAAIGWIFGLIGVVVVVAALTLAVLCVLSARGMQTRRRRTLSLVTAGLLCLTGLLGIALGVFTFIVLLKPETERLYSATATPAL
jgi:hypothetical protein